MSTKFQVKPKYPLIPRKIKEDDEDIIEIEEIPYPKQIKASQKHKENTENTSSEANTPNKKAKNKKIGENELIEIMDVEIPDNSKPAKKKASAPVPGLKNNANKVENENEKKKEKKLIKSVSKIGAKEKNRNTIGKKGEKITNIILNESDNENNENNMQSTTEVKISSQKGKKTSKTPDKNNKNNSHKYQNRKITKTPNKKITSITPNKKIINKSKENANNQNKKNKNIEKIKNKKNEKREDIKYCVQCQLSEESEDEKKQKKNSKNKIQKGKKSNKKANTSKDKDKDKYNSGYLSSRKTSHKMQKNANENENLKSKSTIKINFKNKAMKSKIGNLLGRKRKQPDNQLEKSKTPNKKSNKSESNIVKKYPKQKNKDEKVKSKTPFKNIAKKNIQTNNSKMDIDDIKPNKKCATPELAVLNHLILEYGFEKVLDSLCKPKLDPKIKIDSCLQSLQESCTNEKLPFLLVKMLFSYFQSKFNEKTKKPAKKRSTSVKKINSLKNIIENCDNSDSKIQNNDTKSIFSMMDHVEDNTNPIQIEEEEIQEKKEKSRDKKKEIKSVDNMKNKTNKISPIEENKNDKKATSIGSHYHKTEGGEIYKYQVTVLDGKGNAIFKCYDDKCSGMAIYELDSRNFKETKKHNLKHSEHEYIMNYDKNGDVVFKDLIESEKSNAQVFKEDGERTVKFY